MTVIANNRVQYKIHITCTYVLKYSYQINGVRGGAVGLDTAVSIPGGVIGIFHLPKLSRPLYGPGSTQHLTETAARYIAWG